MTTTAAIEQTQQLLELRLSKFESELTEIKGTPDTSKIEVLSREFQEFKIFAVEMFSLLRTQISELKHTVDELETKGRSDSLLIKGVPEKQNENVHQSVIDIVRDKLNIKDITTQSLRACYRLGWNKDGVTRSILITFYDYRLRHQVWINKTKLKGTQFSVSEFLIKSRQLLFTEARKIVGVRNCWTQDGSVIAKLPNGIKKKILHQSDIDSLSKAVVEKTSSNNAQNIPQVRQKRVVAKK